MNELIGRKKELSMLKTAANSNKSEFVAVYGRRRVGKTFLIRRAFDHNFSFQVTAIANAKTSQQLNNFNIALQKVYPSAENSFATNWIAAFQQLSDYLIEKEARVVPVKINPGAALVYKQRIV